MPIGLVLPMLEHAGKKEKEETIRDIYMAKYPLMVQGHLEFEDYGTFKLRMESQSLTISQPKSYEEIEEEMAQVVKAYERQVNNHEII